MFSKLKSPLNKLKRSPPESYPRKLIFVVMEIQYVFYVYKLLLFLFRVFEKSLQYVKRFSRYKNPDAVRQVREYPQLHLHLNACLNALYHITCLSYLCCESHFIFLNQHADF